MYAPNTFDEFKDITNSYESAYEEPSYSEHGDFEGYNEDVLNAWDRIDNSYYAMQERLEQEIVDTVKAKEGSKDRRGEQRIGYVVPTGVPDWPGRFMPR